VYELSVKFKLIDTDYVICADTDLQLSGEEGEFKKFLKEVKDDLITGKTAFLEIDNMKFEILRAE
jgi:hypothetical protein